MELLYLLESIRTPMLDEIMLLITRLGEETAFLVTALIVFWCVDKRKGYYIMAVGFFGTIASQFLKLACRVPRPWVRDPEFTILEEAREAAAGYSFPSGHSQSAVGTFGAIGAASRNSMVKWICGLVCVLVPLSRMYIGVHTPADVLVGSGLSLALICLLRKPVLKGSDSTMKRIIALLLLAAAAQLAYVEFWPFPADLDVHNLQSGIKNAYTLLGSILGIALVYPMERKYVSFSVRAVWYAQILKIVGGLALVLAVKEGLRVPLEMLFAGHMAARAVRYFAIVVVAGLVWPMTFRFFSKIGEEK